MKKPLVRPLLAAILVGVLAGTPVAPIQAQEPSSPAQVNAAAQGGVPISLGVSKFDFSRPPSWFPNIINPYRTQYVDPGVLTNSPRLDQLIHDGKMPLSLQDAIALALENSMDIVVQRYTPWMADVSLLKARAGGYGYGTPGSIAVGSTANLPELYYDPVLTQTLQFADATTPIANPFISGLGASGGTTSAQPLFSHTATYNTAYTQSFTTGTSLSVAWDNTRASSTADNFFNPYVQSSVNIGFQQQLLAGAGRFVNRRNIIIAENNRKIADLQFAQQAITTVTNTITAYWELVYARENVKVEQQAVTVSDKLYNDNKKQLEIGTMAPLDVTRAESELATDRQNLIVAQTTQLQDELTLKNYIAKDPLASNLLDVEIIPTDKPESPATIETSSFPDAVKEAFQKRPDLQEQYFNLKNAQLDVKFTRNALLPTATLGVQYSSNGLAGNSFITGAPTTISGAPIVDVNGVPIPGYYLPETVTPNTGVAKQGFGTAQSQIFHNNFPVYSGQLTLSLPIRNRANQADNIHAQLVERQFEAEVQQTKNNALLDVRNTTIAVDQGRAQVDAATKARELQQQTFDAEQKKYQLGASTVYNVILTQRDLITAQGTELRALANLAEAKANYERALGRTLEVNNVTIAGAKKGDIEKDTLIPGTMNGQVVGTDELFKALDKGLAPGQK
ncbi:MAG TPA: TolC family protein [Candidatus Acidoferrales bacterium]|nr:TolC family protein [Candidatus Acidoferrales bacterium]